MGMRCCVCFVSASPAWAVKLLQRLEISSLVTSFSVFCNAVIRHMDHLFRCGFWRPKRNNCVSNRSSMFLSVRGHAPSKIFQARPCTVPRYLYPHLQDRTYEKQMCARNHSALQRVPKRVHPRLDAHPGTFSSSTTCDCPGLEDVACSDDIDTSRDVLMSGACEEACTTSSACCASVLD